MANRWDEITPDASPALHIHLLGALYLAWGQEPLPLPRTAAARSLLAYLLLHHDQVQPRDLLAGTFWPDRPDTEARKALSDALWQVRQSLVPVGGRLAVERDAVSLALLPRDTLDVDSFAGPLRRYREQLQGGSLPPAALSACLAELHAAAALYTADLLPECYDDWVLPERERLHEEYLWALEQLTVLAKRWGDDERALAYAQRLVAADPLRETAHRELMRLYHVLGRHRAALEQYAAVRKLLADELGVEPAAATAALYREIQSALEEAGPVHLPAPAPGLGELAHLPFIGRSTERTVLLEALQSAGRGHGGVALIEGAAGVGKSRLVEELVADARWRGFQVGLGRADPLAASAPYQPLCDALAPLLTPLRAAQLAALVEPLWLSASTPLLPTLREQLPDLPNLERLEPQQEQQRLWEGLARCAGGLAAVAPLLLVVEDVHWADGATLAVLSYLAHRLPGQRLLVLLTCRGAEARERAVVWGALEGLDRALPLRRVPLAALAPEESAALVQRALGLDPGDPAAQALTAALQKRSGHNALFLVEMLKAILEQGTRTPGEGWARPDGTAALPTPISLHELIGQRLRRLPLALRTTVELAAVLGEEVGFGLLARASRAEAVELAGHLAGLCQRGFLAETACGYRFEHEVVRETIYGVTNPRRRQALHRQAVTALEALQPEALEGLAHHAAAGGDRPRAARYCRLAGERAAAQYANADALSYLDRALELTPAERAAERYQLLLTRERVHDVQGARAEQQEDLAELEVLARALEDPGRLAEVALRQAARAEATSDYTGAIALARRCGRLARAAGDAATEAASLLRWGVALWRQGDFAGAGAKVERALRVARLHRLAELEAESLRVSGVIALDQGDISRAEKLLEENLRACRQAGNRLAEGRTLSNLGIVFGRRGDYARAREHYEQALRISEEVGDRRNERIALNNLGTSRQLQGDYAGAGRCFEEVLRLARETGDREGEGLALGNLGDVCDYQADYARARDYYRQATAIARAIGQRYIVGWMLGNLGNASTSLGQYGQAGEEYGQALEAVREVGDRQGEGFVLANLGFLFYQVGDSRAAELCCRQALQLAQEAGDRLNQGYALTNLGRALAAMGRHDEAAAAYGEALDIRRQMGQENLAVESLAGLAGVALAQRNMAEARQHVETILDDLGDHTLEGTLGQLWVVLTCYRVLRANLDPRAEGLLRTAHDLLQQQAGRIDDPQIRGTFLAGAIAREIIAAYEAQQQEIPPGPVAVHLPRAGAPSGRPLRDDEWVVVTWTPTLPEDEHVGGKAARRQHRLRRLLGESAAQGAAPTVADLAAALGVDARTIKRDLAALRAAGQRTPTRGQRRGKQGG